MKLIPKAKAVKIRITSGNEEHSSLQSLQENFVWKDVALLFDGRLIKWLRRIGENSIADKLSALSYPKNRILDVYNILFRGDNPFFNPEDVFEACENDCALSRLAEELLDGFSDVKLVEFGKRFDSISLLFSKRLAHHCESFTGDESVTELFSIGEFLYNEGVYKETGKKCIQLAAKGGLKEAQDFKRKYLLAELNDDFVSVLKSKDVIEEIALSWKNNSLIRLGRIRGSRKILYDFSNVCLQVYRESKSDGNSDKLREIFIKYFGSITDVSDPLYKEKVFISALYCSDIEYAKGMLNKIMDYIPAKVILESGALILDKHTYQIGRAFTNSKHLEFFVKNILKFRNYAESGK